MVGSHVLAIHDTGKIRTRGIAIHVTMEKSATRGFAAGMDNK